MELECQKLNHFVIMKQFLLFLVCLPLTVFVNIIIKIQKLIPKKHNHDEEVKLIQKQIQKWNKIPKEERTLLATSRPYFRSLSTKQVSKLQYYQITINLNKILELNMEENWIRAEPYVQIGEITHFLLAKGYTLAVTTEINDATLAGLALTVGISSNSHKMGFFHDNILKYEVLLHDGSFVVASQTENADLFKTLPWSHGSLGFLVSLTLKIIKIKPFVKLCYLPVVNADNYCEMTRLLSGDLNSDYPSSDFIETIIFSKHEAVVITGNYVENPENLPLNHLNYWYKPFYYKYVETFLKTGKYTEIVPIAHYLQRYNRSNFWLHRSILNNFLFRLCFGWILPIKVALSKFLQTPELRKFFFQREIVQNLIVPIRKLEEQINFCHELFEIYPLLVYPCKIYDNGPNSGQLKRPKREYLVEGTNYAIYNTLFIFGTPIAIKKHQKYDTINSIKQMQDFTRKLDGYCYLYADLFMTRSEFEDMFDLSLYKIVRKKYGANDCFPHLFDKIKTDIGVF